MNKFKNNKLSKKTRKKVNCDVKELNLKSSFLDSSGKG